MIDSAIGPLDPATVVEGYLRHSRALYEDDPEAVADPGEPEEAAYDALKNAIHDAPAETAWELVLLLLQRAPDDELGFLAAGPLEDLVWTRGAELVDQIEAEAQRDERFRWALGCIWLSHEDLPEPVLERVVRASGGAIKPFNLEAR